MSNPSISIIIPIYNASKYLNRCIDSIISQTYINFELILINDGSTDNSLQICEYYQNQDDRITIISQKNSGVSAARNQGLLRATGQYVINIDADDWMERDMLSIMYEEAINTDADIVECGYFEECSSGIKTIFVHPYREESPKTSLRIHMGYSAFWNKLIRRKLYTDYSIHGIEGITMWEDNVVTLRLRYHSTKTICVNKPLYHYWVSDGNSMCDNNRGKYPNSEIQATLFLEKYFNEINNQDKYAKNCISNLKVEAKSTIWRHKHLGGVKEWKKVLPLTISDIWISQVKRKEKLFLTILNIMPADIGQIIVNIFINFKKEL